MNFNYLILAVIFLLVVFALGWISIPLFLEKPKYSVELAERNFQIRAYEQHIIAKVITDGERQQALRNGFRPLVRYIGAKERGGNKISMTVPVMQEKNSSNDWSVFFFMPSEFTKNSLPPAVDKNIQFEDVMARKTAAITFSGLTTNQLLIDKEKSLLEWIHQNNYTQIGKPIYAFYNDPLTPSFLRKNEILINVLERQKIKKNYFKNIKK